MIKGNQTRGDPEAFSNFRFASNRKKFYSRPRGEQNARDMAELAARRNTARFFGDESLVDEDGFDEDSGLGVHDRRVQKSAKKAKKFGGAGVPAPIA